MSYGFRIEKDPKVSWNAFETNFKNIEHALPIMFKDTLRVKSETLFLTQVIVLSRN